MTNPNIMYCQYSKRNCEFEISFENVHKGFFIYPSKPALIAHTIMEAVKDLQITNPCQSWMSWEQLKTTGQIVFCSICEAIRQSERVIANITTLNFNVMFELGFAIGCQKAVIPVRDTSYERDQHLFEQLGIFDVLGYKEFENSKNLKKIVLDNLNVKPIKLNVHVIDKKQPTFVLKSPYDTDGSIRLHSALKKSSLYRFRVFDPRETPRLSLHEAHHQITSSLAVIAHLVDPNRRDAITHNALCAFVCGMAMAMGKHILMLQEGYTRQPIDYRDVVIQYENMNTVTLAVENFVRAVARRLFDLDTIETIPVEGFLEQIDLGDTAAENEIRMLDQYFVSTPQYQQAKLGHARLVVGRKGSGKTAIFYTVRHYLANDRSIFTLDLKPEGHSFTKLRETVTNQMSEGVQLHTLTSFWNYLLLLEIAKKLLDKEIEKAWRDPGTLRRYEEFKKEYLKHSLIIEGDFSERIMALVNRVIDEYPEDSQDLIDTGKITQMIYKHEVSTITKLIGERLKSIGELWLLFDNIDKGWTLQGATPSDVAVVRSLLEATRKLQRSLNTMGIDFKSIVFLRKDIADLLIEYTPDRGKEPIANLDWSDQILLEELLYKRFHNVPGLEGEFRDIWGKLFDAHVGGEDSFRYILTRSFFQPRALLNFVTKAIHIAASRDHKRVLEDDILTAEIAYAEDMFNSVRLEIRDVYPRQPKLLYSFLGQDSILSQEDLYLILMEAEIAEDEFESVSDLLLWYAFIGILVGEDEHYSYQVGYNLEKLKAYCESRSKSNINYVIHPVFRKAISI
ncbi:MAG: hypothetical protein K8S15_14600 [Candidatus Aegiribacteria sp.]|nr:hypothetical protein [Candidatus Aegiribacteria sp.]